MSPNFIIMWIAFLFLHRPVLSMFEHLISVIKSNPSVQALISVVVLSVVIFLLVRWEKHGQRLRWVRNQKRRFLKTRR